MTGPGKCSICHETIGSSSAEWSICGSCGVKFKSLDTECIKMIDGVVLVRSRMGDCGWHREQHSFTARYQDGPYCKYLYDLCGKCGARLYPPGAYRAEVG